MPLCGGVAREERRAVGPDTVAPLSRGTVHASDVSAVRSRRRPERRCGRWVRVGGGGLLLARAHSGATPETGDGV